MAIQIQLRQGTTTEHNTFTGAVGEVTVDTTKDVPVVHDGVTVGGHPVAARANADGTISLIKKDGTSAGTINALGLFNNTLTSTNTNQALTAAQGKVLKDTLDTAVSSAFGIGQSYVNVTSSRVFNTTYTNSTAKMIFVICTTVYNSGGMDCKVYINNDEVCAIINDGDGSVNAWVTFPVPAGASYRVDGSRAMQTWWEVR